MLQPNELYSRWRNILQTIDIASDACMSDENVPGELRASVLELDQQSEVAKQVLATANPRRIVEAVDELEEYCDRAMRACRNATSLHPETKNAVVKVHDQLSDLKHLLH